MIGVNQQIQQGLHLSFMSEPVKISCYIRTLNEERMIGEVIRAAFKVCSEVIIVDSLSTDRTREIAEQEGAKIVEQVWLGNGYQKRIAEEHCVNDWLLDLDADEVVSDDLAEEINALFAGGEPGHHVYRLSMALVTPQGEIWHTEVQSKRAKLYDRRYHRMPEHRAWDQLKLASSREAPLLRGKLLHHAFTDLAHLLQKQNSWSTMGATSGTLKPYWIIVLRIVFGLPVYLLRHYFLRRLWKNGIYGFAYSMIVAFGRWMRDVKMLERHMTTRQKKNETSSFGNNKLRFPLTALRAMALKQASRGKLRTISSELTRTYAKLAGGAYDIEWQGLKLRIYPSENFDDKAIFRTGIHPEQKDLDFLEERYRGKVINAVDIGANIGTYSLFLWKISDRSSRLLCFEPTPDTFAKLKENLTFNQAENVVALEYAIGEEERAAFLYRSNKENFGENSLVPDCRDCEAMEIRLRPLAPFLQEHGFTFVDFLKIDVEGYEDRVLLPFLRTCSPDLLPKLVMLEDNRKKWQTDCLDYLTSRGYQLERKIGANLYYCLKD